MSKIPTKRIDGDVSIGRHVATGGDARVQGSAHVYHNLRVDGWLEAKNIKYACKGLFLDEATLVRSYPEPELGWWALVGTSLPAHLYYVEEEGGAFVWKDTDELSGEVNVDVESILESLHTSELDVEQALNDAATAKEIASKVASKVEPVLTSCTMPFGGFVNNVSILDESGATPGVLPPGSYSNDVVFDETRQCFLWRYTQVSMSQIGAEPVVAYRQNWDQKSLYMTASGKPVSTRTYLNTETSVEYRWIEESMQEVTSNQTAILLKRYREWLYEHSSSIEDLDGMTSRWVPMHFDGIESANVQIADGEYEPEVDDYGEILFLSQVGKFALVADGEYYTSWPDEQSGRRGSEYYNDRDTGGYGYRSKLYYQEGSEPKIYVSLYDSERHTMLVAVSSGSSSGSGTTDPTEIDIPREVLPFDGIETLTSGTILEQSKLGEGAQPSSPTYYEGFGLIFDTTSRSFALKAPTHYTDGVADAWQYFGGWDETYYAYYTPMEYRQALSSPNTALFLNRTDGKPYRYEGGTLIATAGSGTGGDSSVTQSTINQLSSRITALESAMYPLSLSLSASPSLAEYTGASVSVTVTRTLKRSGSNVASADITSAYTKYATNTIDSSTDNPKSVSQSVSTYGTHQFSAGASAFGMSATASCSVRLELPMYFGFASQSAASSLVITSLVKQSLKTSASGTYTLSNATSGQHMWLCVPSSMNISAVKSNGFDVPMLAAETASTTLGNYKCYRSASESGINAGSLTITVS